MFRNLFQSRKFIIALCIILFVILVVLMACELRDPEAGSEMVRGLLHQG